jgi:glycosyltransferase involved in cell wall biosynthesis
MVILNLSNLCWSGGQQRRNQAIFSHLLQCTELFDEGIFVQPPKVKLTGPFQFLKEPEVETVARLTHLGRPVTVLQPVLSLPSGYPQAASNRALRRLAEMLIEGALRDKPYLLWIGSIAPIPAQLAERLMPTAQFRVFGESDLLSVDRRQPGKPLLRHNTDLLARCDAAVFSSEKAAAQVEHHTKRVFPPCIDFGMFQKHTPDLAYPHLFPKPENAVYIGFTGMLASGRTDVNLLHALLLRFPDYRFIFAGSADRPGIIADLKQHRHFHHIDLPDESLRAAVLNQLDAAIVPDLEFDDRRATGELKLLEYFACGLPVLSTSHAHALKFEGLVTSAGSVWEFLHALERLTTKHRHHSPGPGIALARQQSWANQARQFGDWLADRLVRKSTSSRTESAAQGR